MSELTIKQSKLLKDFDDICKQANIKYCLYGRSAVQAELNGAITDNFIQVLMNCADVVKFIDSFENAPVKGRSISGMFNDKDYSGLTVRFEDTSTSSLHIYSIKKRKIEAGVYIEIIPLRGINPELNSIKNRAEEQGYEYSNCPIHLINGSFSKLATILFKIRHLFGKNKSAKRYFYEMMSICEKGDMYCVKEPFKQTKVLTFNPLFSLMEIEVLGGKYFIPANNTDFYKTIFGTNWSKKALSPISGNLMCFENMSIRELNAFMRENGMSVKNYKKQKYIITDTIINKQTRKKNNIWKAAQMVDTRIKLGKFYSDKMNLIYNLIECNDYPRIYKVMSKNRNAVRKYLKLGYGFAVNKELFDIQNSLYIKEGKAELVEKLNKITPKCFLD